MKKIFAVLLILVVATAFAACQTEDTNTLGVSVGTNKWMI